MLHVSVPVPLRLWLWKSNQSINKAVLNHPVYQKLFWDENTSFPMREKSFCFLLRMNQTAQVTFCFESLNLSPRFVPCHYQLGIIYTCCATHLLILAAASDRAALLTPSCCFLCIHTQAPHQRIPASSVELSFLRGAVIDFCTLALGG